MLCLLSIFLLRRNLLILLCDHGHQFFYTPLWLVCRHCGKSVCHGGVIRSPFFVCGVTGFDGRGFSKCRHFYNTECFVMLEYLVPAEYRQVYTSKG